MPARMKNPMLRPAVLPRSTINPASAEVIPIMDCVGLAYTEVPDTVQTETDLINCIKAQEVIGCGGTLYRRTTKEKIGKVNTVLVYSFWFYNKFFTLVKTHKRNRKLRAEYSDREAQI